MNLICSKLKVVIRTKKNTVHVTYPEALKPCMDDIRSKLSKNLIAFTPECRLKNCLGRFIYPRTESEASQISSQIGTQFIRAGAIVAYRA